jgi:FtsH-binding integral membrane protein
MNQLTPMFPGSGAQATAGVRANPYIARTYTVLLNALAVIVVAGVVSHQFLPRTTLMPFAIADMVLWIACGWFGWMRPLTLAMGLFSVVTGGLLGQVAHLTPPGIFAQASAYTLVTFAGLSFYVHVTKKDFSFLKGFLIAAFWIALLSTVIMLFFPGMRATMPFAAFGTLVFAGWILYDTSNVVHHVDSTEAAGFAAFALLLDLIGLFKNLLNLLWSFAED